MPNDNMKLWNQVCKTDPNITRPVSYGNRTFTAIDAQHQIKRATELWGAIGNGWGLFELQFGYIGEDGKLPAEVTLDAVFRFPNGKFPISVDIKYKPGGESRKKLMTDATTKALSKLGFNSDVFEGKFDDNKYVAEQKEAFAERPKTETTKELKQKIIDGVELVAEKYKEHRQADILSMLTEGVPLTKLKGGQLASVTKQIEQILSGKLELMLHDGKVIFTEDIPF